MQLKINSLTKSFGSKIAVSIDQLIVNDGELVGVVGNNGAGKTTLFRLILDLLKPDTGEIFIDNMSVVDTELWKECTGAFVDDSFLIDYLTPDEYFDFICKVNGIDKVDYQHTLKQFDHIMNGEIAGVNKLIRNLSAGNKQKVGIIGAMFHHPQLLILDEPFNFLDPSSQLSMKKVLSSYSQQTGAIVLISSHNLTHTFDLCNRITLLENGVIIKDIKTDNVESRKDIEDYFINQS